MRILSVYLEGERDGVDIEVRVCGGRCAMCNVRRATCDMNGESLNRTSSYKRRGSNGWNRIGCT